MKPTQKQTKPKKSHPWKNPDAFRGDPHNGRHPALPNWQGRMLRR